MSNTKREEILKVLKYEDGNYYVGSMQMCAVARILDISYPDDSIPKAVKEASNGTVEEVYHELRHYIKHMKQHPKKTCSRCGSIVAA